MPTPSRSVAFPLVLLIAVACGTGAIVATYSQLSHTWDEGIHLAAGLEVLQDGKYTYQTENPPLARVVNAIIPYLRGTRLPPPDRRLPAIQMAVDARVLSDTGLHQSRHGWPPRHIAVLLGNHRAHMGAGWRTIGPLGGVARLCQRRDSPDVRHACRFRDDGCGVRGRFSSGSSSPCVDVCGRHRCSRPRWKGLRSVSRW
jgi:hypothetical protein